MPDPSLGRFVHRVKWALIWTWEAWDRRYDPYVRGIAWRRWKAIFRTAGAKREHTPRGQSVASPEQSAED